MACLIIGYMFSGTRLKWKVALHNVCYRSPPFHHEKGANLTMASLLRILDIHRVTLREFIEGLDA
ncbi:hypothetical protein ACFSKU_02195 [Pontibacter silvestris]|uniref:Uncharacterized protein n=1 Tax=Pontibacter silvestris TaxID=2305183 RepID=A0ABW4WSF0_9BACT|nr:hypothetical protein [Pontibacter silvestris]MCC9139051.1 hypothetical protein [Pontibacter silvestris]